jgi:AcrR family transcriptional regulator
MVETASWMIRADQSVDLASVAAVAGVSRVTAYRSFSSLDDLVARVRGVMSAQRAVS